MAQTESTSKNYRALKKQNDEQVYKSFVFWNSKENRLKVFPNLILPIFTHIGLIIMDIFGILRCMCVCRVHTHYNLASVHSIATAINNMWTNSIEFS